MRIERQVRTKVRGVTFRPVNFDVIKPGDPLILCREHDNPIDANAIRVVHRGAMIGYVSAQLAEDLAPLMDGNVYQVGASVDCVTGGIGEAHNHGINMTITVGQEVPDALFPTPALV